MTMYRVAAQIDNDHHSNPLILTINQYMLKLISHPIDMSHLTFAAIKYAKMLSGYRLYLDPEIRSRSAVLDPRRGKMCGFKFFRC